MDLAIKKSKNKTAEVISTGIVKRIDDLGRIHLPTRLREQLMLEEGDLLEMYVTNDEIIIKKYERK